MSALRVLHVDDEPDIREVTELALGLDPDITVRGCRSGSDAIAAAAEWAPDLILLDVMMPTMDGPTTLRHLRHSPQTATIPVVFMTARAQPRELDHFLSLGAEGVIAKPFDPMTLAVAVRNYASGLAANIADRRNNFLKRMCASGEALADCRARLSDRGKATDTLRRVRTIAHSIAGGAGIFGFAEISDKAARLETAVVDRLDGKTSDVEQALDALVARIKAT